MQPPEKPTLLGNDRLALPLRWIAFALDCGLSLESGTMTRVR